ncbi:MAG: response regulator [Chitinivibrionales bacterium]|nr:response regulator [Chitinivibrionales bacterium]MBD3356769.1 response regulator [Chitinivibrionales bacterium]
MGDWVPVGIVFALSARSSYCDDCRPTEHGRLVMARERDHVVEELERELSAARKQLSDCLAILRVVPDIVYKVDPQGHFVFVSDSIRELGYTPEELQGKHFSVLVHGEDVVSVSRSAVLPKYTGRVTGRVLAPKLFDERRTGERKTKNLVLRLNRKEEPDEDEGDKPGRLQFYGEVMATGHYDRDIQSKGKRFLGTVGTIREIGAERPLPGRGDEGQDEYDAQEGDGVFAGTVGVIRDVTERRRLERQKRELQARLFQARKMEAVGQLAAGIAHDFNNILGAISGYADLLTRKLGDRDPKLAKYAGTIMAGANRAAGLTTKLLSFARKGRYRSLEIDMHSLVTEVMAALRDSSDMRIILRKEFSARTATVLGDPDQLRDALFDVALNAKDALSEQGEIVFASFEANVDGEFCYTHGLDSASRDYLVISVHDSGVGMDEETRKRVFEPFFTTKEAGKGTGLGLASAHGVIEAHRGTMEVESARGEGTTVRMYLPMFREGTAGPVRETIPICGDYEPSGKRILIIDDEEVFLDAGGEMLRALGHKVILFRSVSHALEFYQDNYHRVDLVIIDMDMPAMRGDECYRRLKRINGEVKALIATGHNLDEAAEKLLEDGVTGFMQKPFLIEQLRESIGRILYGNNS